MPLEPKKSRIVLFFVAGIGLALLMAGLKALFAWIAHTYAYSVPWIGGFLRSIEITEISNLLVFAILGAGIGAATILLPTLWNHKLKLAFLVALSPFVFSASYLMQQHLWIQQVANRGNISYREAKTITNTYLKRETGKSGFFGFYPFTTQIAEMPTRLEILRSDRSANPNRLLTQELSNYDDPRADFAAYVFERVGWLVRFMYMTIAALTAVIYYFKGALWADTRKRGGNRLEPRQANGKRVVSDVPAPAAVKKSFWPSNEWLKSTDNTNSKGLGKKEVPGTQGKKNKVSEAKRQKPLIGKPSSSPTAKPAAKPISNPITAPTQPTSTQPLAAPSTATPSIQTPKPHQPEPQQNSDRTQPVHDSPQSDHNT